MTRNLRISVRLDETDRDRIEQRIKKEYPKLRNISDIVRAALSQFLKENT
jgi:Arc/MetJ-type ribon-helix-helix transcriptional regulator